MLQMGKAKMESHCAAAKPLLLKGIHCGESGMAQVQHDFQDWIFNLQDQADIQAAGMHQGQLQQGQRYYDPSTGMRWFTNGNYGPVPPTVPTQHYPATAPATAPTATTPIMRTHTHLQQQQDLHNM